MARERLDVAIGQLDGVVDQSPDEIEHVVHEVRKRCKEVRALARLVREPIGSEYDRFNQLVRDAANELSPIRDAHAVLGALDDLRAARDCDRDPELEVVRWTQAEAAADATSHIRGGDPRIQLAHGLLVKARRRVSRWDIDEGAAWLRSGLTATYGRGRRGLRQAEKRDADERMHEWRKSVKTLWYQVRLVEAAAPSVLSPLIAHLDELADALGDDHDLSVLVERLEADPRRFGGKPAVKTAVSLARSEQAELRQRAFRLGASVYAEPTSAFVDRLESYWKTTLRRGPELATGSIAQLLADERHGEARARPQSTDAPEVWVERERKFLVTEVPELTDAGTGFRQGYVAIDGAVAVRVRDAGDEGCTMTVKVGQGAVRTEFEWSITAEQFDAVWSQTQGRRIHKTRHRLPLGEVVVDLDVFHDELDGLVLAEVEFGSSESMEAFSPPGWFGDEVTDDVSYANSSLAVNGRSH